MAEIKVEKRNSPWWLWVLGAVLVLALLMWLLGGNREASDQAPAQQSSVLIDYAEAVTDQRAA